MRRWTLFSFFLASLVMTVVSFAQNPQAVPAANNTPPSAAPGKPAMPPGNPTNPGASGLTPPLPPPPPQAPPNPDAEMPVFQNPEGYHYDPTGRRDPFKPFGESQTTMAPELGPAPDQPTTPPEPLQTFDVTQFKLLGIIWQVKDPKAMVLDPNGRTHLIRRQTKIGRNNGFVAAIREGEVIVVEPSVGENGVQTAVTRIMNLK
jgi:type IV pilus assembly protein PilP